MNSEEVSEGYVSQLMEMGLVNTREEAISKLKTYNNDLTRAVDSIIESPSTGPLESQANVWEESHFHTDKNGQSNQDLPSYSNQASDRLQPNVFGAPSRPPSRVHSRGIIDLTPEHASADPSKSLGYDNQQREDQDLQRAVELSMSDLGTQETGVTVQKGVHFGPATRDYYDTNKWALTPHSSTQEVVLDPEPADRRRLEGEPAFLRSSPSAPYLAPLLTILHSIPLARETLLYRDQSLRDYGYDDEWWSGSPLKAPGVTSIDGLNSTAELDQIIYETQRLMAFLDMTGRSYGSVEGLARLDRVQNSGGYGVLTNYLKSWQEAAQRRRQSHSQPGIFSSTGVKLLGSTGVEVARESFKVLDLRVENENNTASPSQTLYQAMDGMIWEGNDGAEETMVYLEEIGEVFTIRMVRTEQGKNEQRIDVPAIWYPDRYLEESKETAREMRSKRAAVYKIIEELDELQGKITSYQPSHRGSPVDPRKLLQSSIRYLEQLCGMDDRVDENKEAKMTDGDERQSFEASSIEAVNQLKAIYDSVVNKLKSLDEQKDKARESLAEISAVLTRPSDDPKINPRRRYTLRGVSTEPHITYVLCAMEGEDANNASVNQENREEGHEMATKNYQWWRMSFTSGDSNPVSKTKVTEEQVLQAAGEGQTTLLVYASERATDPTYNRPLPRTLINFIRADNRAFQSELENSTQSLHDVNQDQNNTHPANPEVSSTAEISSVRWGGQTPPLPPPAADEEQQSEQAEIRITSEYFDNQSVVKNDDDVHQQQEATTSTTAANTISLDDENKSPGEETTTSTATMSGQEDIGGGEGGGGKEQEMEDFSLRPRGREEEVMI